MKELIRRWKASTPKFWKKVIHFMVTVATVCTAGLALTQVPGFEVDPVVTKCLSYVLLASVLCGAQAKLTEA